MSPVSQHLDLRDTLERDDQGMTIFEVRENFTYTMEILPPHKIEDGERSNYYAAFPLIVTVKEGYRTNLSSVPRFLWSIFPPVGDTNSAAVIHDLLCETGILPRHIADSIFRQIMKETNVPFIKRTCIYYGVRLGAVYNTIRDQYRTYRDKRTKKQSTDSPSLKNTQDKEQKTK